MTNIRIIGIGSANGLDQTGWLVLDTLKKKKFAQRFPPDRVSLHGHATPAHLPNLLDGTALAIIIDAMEGEPGAVTTLRPEELWQPTNVTSSHGLGVSEGIELAMILGEVPGHISIYGIGIGAATLVEPVAPSPLRVIMKSMPIITDALTREVNGFLTQQKAG